MIDGLQYLFTFSYYFLNLAAKYRIIESINSHTTVIE